MREGWRGARREGSPCGTGVLREHTASIRTRLPGLLREYGIRSVCDAGAGDLCWARETLKDFDYRPFDLVPRRPEVAQLDITKHALPECDAILCRAVLIHLDPPRIQRAIELFRGSAKYLLASQYNVLNAFDPGSQFNPTNLIGAPYFLGKPLEQIPDLEGGVATLALWKI